MKLIMAVLIAVAVLVAALAAACSFFTGEDEQAPATPAPASTLKDNPPPANVCTYSLRWGGVHRGTDH